MTFDDLKPFIDEPHAHIKTIVKCANLNPFLVNAAKTGKDAFLTDYNAFDDKTKKNFR
jgi:hypothetical protein